MFYLVSTFRPHRAMLGIAAIVLATSTGCADRSGGSAATPAVDEWTMLGQDLGSHYHNRAEKILSPENVAGLKQAWKLTTAGPVTSAPAVVDGTLYAVSSGGTYAVDAATGTVKWRRADVMSSSSATVAGDVVYVNGQSAKLWALDKATGATLWANDLDEHPAAAGWSSPVVFDRYVVVGGSSAEEAIAVENATFRGSVIALDRDTGEVVWRTYTANPPHNGASVWSTVSIDPEARHVFASTGNNYTEEAGPTSDSIFCLDLDTGEIVWLNQLTEGDVFTIFNPQSPDTDFGTNPILFEAKVGGRTRKLLGAGQKSGVFWTLDRETGEVVWSHAVSPGSALIGGILNNGAYDGERLILVGNNGESTAPGSEPSFGSRGETSVLTALDPGDGHVLWERQLGQWVWAPLTIAGGVGFLGVDHFLEAFDVRSGERLFRFETKGTIASTPTVTGGRVYFGSGLSYFVGTPDRTLYALSLDGNGGGGGGGGGNGAAKFSSIYDEIFVAQGCNLGSCHGTGQGGFSMASKDDAYADLVGVVSDGPLCASTGATRVVPGDPGASLLYAKVSSSEPPCGAPMPPAGALPAAQVEQIRAWIAAGAAND